MRIVATHSRDRFPISVWRAAIELVSHTELLRNMVVRDLKVRYRNSALGFGWSLLQPLLMMLVFTIVFKVLTRTEIPNYPLFLLTGLLPWNFTHSALSSALRSITGNSALITKVYFPRELLPLSTVLGAFVHFVLAFVLLLIGMTAFGVEFHATVLLVPVIMLLQLVLIAGLAMILAAANVIMRDLEQLVDVGLLAWFFLTPIFYALAIVPNDRFLGLDIHRWVFSLNPMATLVTDYRYIMMEGFMPIRHTAVTVATAAVAITVGWWLIRRFSPRFAEVV
ncbi:MAG: ABC transporter permease [Chloroflexi bacterium]|nr:ABC transporter permease [Chloroflexota bacterium]MCY3939097.1 ABC transporter permease [Chloroflexota bacterium]